MGFIYNIGDPDTHEVLYRTYSLDGDHDSGAAAAMAEASAAGVTGVLLNSADALTVDTATIDRQGAYLMAVEFDGAKHPSLKIVQVSGNTRQVLLNRATQAIAAAGVDTERAVLSLVCPDETGP